MSAWILLVCAAVLLVAWWAAWRRGMTGWPVGVASLAAPTAVTLVVLLAAPRFGDLRVALEGLVFDLAPGEQVRVGGSRETDHLVVGDLPAGFLVLEARDGVLTARLGETADETVDDDSATRPVAVVRVGEDGFHNTARLEDGAVFETPGASWRFEDDRFVPVGADGEHATAESAGPPLPGRRDASGLPILRHLPPDVEIWPLTFYGRAPTAPPVATGAFVYRDGFLNRVPYVALTEPGSALRPPQGEAVPYRTGVFELAAGEERSLALYRVDRIEPSMEGERAAGRSRTQERRSFRVAWDGSRLRLRLDTPLYVRLEPEDLERLRDASGAHRGDALLALTGAAGDAQVAGDEVMLLSFPVLGTPLATELFSRITLPGGSGGQREGVRVVTHDRSRRYDYGDVFPVGDHAAALLRVSKPGAPWGALALLWATALAALGAGATLRREPLVLLLLTGAEWCLGYRLLLAYEGALLDPASAAAAWRSLAAWLWVPFLLQTGLALYRRRAVVPTPRHLLHGAVAALAALLVTLQVPAEGAMGWIWRGVAVLAPLGLGVGAGVGLRGLDGLLDRVAAWRGRVSEGGRELLRLLGLLLAVVFVFRLLGLFVMGWKEALTLGGQRLAVSIFMTPVSLLLFALLWPARRRPWAPFAFGGLLVVLYGLIPVAARDWGTALVFSLPPMLLFAGAAFESRAETGERRALRWLYLVPLGLTFLLHLALGTSWLRQVAPLGDAGGGEAVAAARQDEAAARRLLERRADADANRLRFWSRADPRALQRVGTARSEGLAIVVEHWEAFGSRGPTGEGYLNVPLTDPLRATHLDDNLSAVHVLGAFGWLGALGLLLPLVFWGLAPALAGEDPASAWGARQAFGWMTVWSFPVAALYMFSANASMMLFTGKNVYFLAAASLSDLVEATLLVLLALWALAPGRQPEPPPIPVEAR